MARILYGVHGTGHGHSIRALAVARHYPQHDFLFVSHGDGIATLRGEFPVHECPNPETPVSSHRVRPILAMCSALRIQYQRSALMRSILKTIETFKPDVAITDYEFFVPRACALAGVPTLSLDHQHVITLCSLSVPLLHYPSYAVTSWAIRSLFSAASAFIVTSFFHAEPKRRYTEVKVVPPLLRQDVLRREPRDDGHVLAYQGYSTFRGFVPFLREIKRPVVIYGVDSARKEGNLIFKSPSEQEFLDDLASCCYVICGGGHTLISEALFYGKPIISFPVCHAFEQFLNAFQVARSGFGQYWVGFDPAPSILADFEGRLDSYRSRIKSVNFCGNSEIFDLLDNFISGTRLVPRPSTGC